MNEIVRFSDTKKLNYGIITVYIKNIPEEKRFQRSTEILSVIEQIINKGNHQKMIFEKITKSGFSIEIFFNYETIIEVIGIIYNELKSHLNYIHIATLCDNSLSCIITEEDMKNNSLEILKKIYIKKTILVCMKRNYELKQEELENILTTVNKKKVLKDNKIVIKRIYKKEDLNIVAIEYISSIDEVENIQNTIIKIVKAPILKEIQKKNTLFFDDYIEINASVRTLLKNEVFEKKEKEEYEKAITNFHFYNTLDKFFASGRRN